MRKERVGFALCGSFCTHGQVLEELAALAKELVPFETFLTAQAGCTVCSHCGPGTVGMFYAVK